MTTKQEINGFLKRFEGDLCQDALSDSGDQKQKTAGVNRKKDHGAPSEKTQILVPPFQGDPKKREAGQRDQRIEPDDAIKDHRESGLHFHFREVLSQIIPSHHIPTDRTWKDEIKKVPNEVQFQSPAHGKFF